MHQHRLAAFRPRRAVKHLVGGHVGEDQADDLRRVQVLGHIDRILPRHADEFSVCAPLRQRADAVSHMPPRRGVCAELVDDADELISRREWRFRPAEIRAGAHLGIAEGHAGGQDPDADLAATRSGIVRLDDLYDFGTAEPVDQDSLHVISLPVPNHSSVSTFDLAPCVGKRTKAHRR